MACWTCSLANSGRIDERKAKKKDFALSNRSFPPLIASSVFTATSIRDTLNKWIRSTIRSQRGRWGRGGVHGLASHLTCTRAA